MNETRAVLVDKITSGTARVGSSCLHTWDFTQVTGIYSGVWISVPEPGLINQSDLIVIERLRGCNHDGPMFWKLVENEKRN